MKHCSSQYLILEITIHSKTIIQNTDIIQNILTIQSNNIPYSYWCQFLPIWYVFFLER